jgi:hypothetical protein
MHLSLAIMASLEFQTAEASHEAIFGLVRLSLSQPTNTCDPDPASAFNYLLREPRHARRLRHALHILVGVAILVAVAGS